MSVIKVTQPRHYLLDHIDWTACGIRAASHRPIVTTLDPTRATCRKCFAWLRKEGNA